MFNILSEIARKTAEKAMENLNSFTSPVAPKTIAPIVEAPIVEAPIVEAPRSTLTRSPKGVANLALLGLRSPKGVTNLADLTATPKGVKDLTSLDQDGVRLDSLPTKKTTSPRR